MTPEQARKLDELYEWMQQKKIQQIDHPLDDASRNVLGAVTDEGTGSTALTDSINLTGNVQTITVPKAYADTQIIKIGSTRMEIPVISYP